MKKRNLFGFLCKPEPAPAPAPAPEKELVYGITAQEHYSIRCALECEYALAASRQRADAAAPSAYMKGLKFAIKLLEATMPHEVGVEL